jgi:outer membrane protein OmpA-like peptidoglycan-associated protein
MSMSGGMFMSPRNSIKLMALGVGLVVLTTAGCATKKFVRQSVQESIQPLQASLNKVDQKTDQNAEQIRDVDRKAESGIAQAQNAADQAHQAAMTADQHAQAAQQVGEKGLAQANEAQEMVNNIDNYKPAQQATVLFGFNKSILTTEDKQRLDQLVQNVKTLKHYVIEVQGYTDSTGSKAYNLQLSQRRADAVVRYLTMNGDIPLVKIHNLGYGEAAAVNPNNTRKGRALNRRVQITVFVPQMPNASQSAAQLTPAEPSQ